MREPGSEQLMVFLCIVRLLGAAACGINARGAWQRPTLKIASQLISGLHKLEDLAMLLLDLSIRCKFRRPCFFGKCRGRKPFWFRRIWRMTGAICIDASRLAGGHGM